MNKKDSVIEQEAKEQLEELSKEKWKGFMFIGTLKEDVIIQSFQSGSLRIGDLLLMHKYLEIKIEEVMKKARDKAEL